MSSRLGDLAVLLTVKNDRSSEKAAVDAARRTGDSVGKALTGESAKADKAIVAGRRQAASDSERELVNGAERAGAGELKAHEKTGQAVVKFYDKNGKEITNSMVSSSKAAGTGYLSSMLGTVSKGMGGLKNIVGKAAAGAGRALKTGLTGAAVGAMVGIGTALVKGFSRLTAIDDARQKLLGLGNSAVQVDAIMKNALASVKGTSFGMDEAATTAASMVASGIKPGKELERTLKLTADAATIAGDSMDSMGLIFGSVAAKGKLQGDDLMQLTERGIPVLALLAKSMGKTKEEVSKMSSAGKIDFEMFQKAMELGLGGAAATSGKTFSGAMDNIGAAISRTGANLMSGFFPKIAPLLQAVSKAMGPIEDQAKALGSVIGAKLSPIIDKLTKIIQGGLPKFEIIPGIIAPIAGAMAALGANGIAPLLGMIPGLGGLAGAIGGISGPAGLAIGAFLYLVKTSAPLQEALAHVWYSVQELWAVMSKSFSSASKTLIPAFLKAFESLGPVLATVFDGAADLINGFTDALSGGSVSMGGFSSAAKGIWDAASGLLAALLPLTASLVSLASKVALGAVVAGFQILNAVLKPVGALLSWLGGLMQRHTSETQALAGAVLAAVVAFKGFMILKEIVGFVRGAGLALKLLGVYMRVAAIGQAALNLVMSLNPLGILVIALAAVTAAIVVLWKKNEGFRKAILGAWGAIKSFFSGIGDWFSGVFSKISGAFGSAGDGASSAKDRMVSIWSGIPGFFSGIWDKISGAVQAGASAVVGFLKSYWPILVGVLGGPLGATIVLITKNWETIKAVFLSAVSWVMGSFKAAWGRIVDIFGPPLNTARKIIEVFTAAAIMGLQALWNWVSGVFGKLWSGVVAIFSSVFNWVKRLLTDFVQTEIRGFQNIWNWVSGTFRKLWNGVAPIFAAVFNWVNLTNH